MNIGVYLLFPVIELPARGVSIAQVSLCADIDSAEAPGKLLAFIIDSFAFFIGRLRSDTARHDDDLDTNYPWRDDESLVIAVDHDHNTNGSGRQAPRVLPDVDLTLTDRVIGVLHEDIKHVWVGEVGSKAVRGSTLNTTTGSGDEPFNSGGVEATSEFLLFRLDTWNDRNRKQFFVYAAV